MFWTASLGLGRSLGCFLLLFAIAAFIKQTKQPRCPPNPFEILYSVCLTQISSSFYNSPVLSSRLRHGSAGFQSFGSNVPFRFNFRSSALLHCTDSRSLMVGFYSVNTSFNFSRFDESVARISGLCMGFWNCWRFKVPAVECSITRVLSFDRPTLQLHHSTESSVLETVAVCLKSHLLIWWQAHGLFSPKWPLSAVVGQSE